MDLRRSWLKIEKRKLSLYLCGRLLESQDNNEVEIEVLTFW